MNCTEKEAGQASFRGLSRPFGEVPVLSATEMREADARASAACGSLELIRRAGAALAGRCIERGGRGGRLPHGSRVGIVCGSGNNAADGYAAAPVLLAAGMEPVLVRLGDRCSADGEYLLDLCTRAAGGGKIGIIQVDALSDIPDLSSFDLLIDCIFGIGFRGEPEGVFAEVIRRMNASGTYTVSADINSGLSADGGTAGLCVKSDITLAFGSFKFGHFAGMAADVMKEKYCAGAGIDPPEEHCRLVSGGFFAPELALRKHFSHKGDYGYTALIGGSLRYSGSVKLASLAAAAMRAGAGVVKVAAPDTVCRALLPRVLESTLFPLPETENGEMSFSPEALSELTGNVRSAAFGMGAGRGDGARKTLGWLLDNFRGTLAVDADGLTLLASMGRDRVRNAACRLILTPHTGEFSRLTGSDISEINAAPAAAAQEYAADTGAVVLLKGPATVITSGTPGSTLLTDAGCPGMATAGSGDVLSGILAAVCGYVPDPLRAAAFAALINGRAGELAEAANGDICMTAGDTAAAIPLAVAALRAEAGIVTQTDI